MLAATRERPSAADKPAVSRGFGRADRLGRACHDDVGAVAVDVVESLAWQQRSEDRSAAADHRGPAERSVDTCNSRDNVECGWKIELQPAMAAWHEHAKDADRLQ